jgi:hypothetical protein
MPGAAPNLLCDRTEAATHLEQSLRDLAVILLAHLGVQPVELVFDFEPALPR